MTPCRSAASRPSEANAYGAAAIAKGVEDYDPALKRIASPSVKEPL